MIKIIDYGSGNSGSIRNMLSKLGTDVSETKNPDELANARLIILPGVGSFDNGMGLLKSRGFDDAIKEVAKDKKTIFLGICLGTQLLFDASEEGKLSGLGLIPGKAQKFQFENASLKVPHMGWSKVQQVGNSSFLDGVFEDARFYFAHSYYISCSAEWVIGKTNYGVEFPSVIRKNNIFGAQFHPEKSHKYGLNLLKRFVDLVRE